MEFTDRLLTCVECSKEFIFTAGEQLFFFDKQFKNDPKRCKPCKSKRFSGATKQATGGPAAAGISRTETRTHCSECGVETTVPFRPTQGRPVLCRACFQSKRVDPAPAMVTPGAEAVANMPAGMLAGQPMADAAMPIADGSMLDAAAISNLAQASQAAMSMDAPADASSVSEPPAEA